MKTYFISYSNLSDGVLIDYGTTHCCPLGSSDPGITGSLRVQLLILPECSSGKDWTVHHVPSIDVLKNCSMATNGAFQIQLGTRLLCPGNNHVLWKLSPPLSTLRCAETSVAVGNQLKCQLHPVWAYSMPVDRINTVCQGLQVQVFYSYGRSQENVTYELEATLPPCSFTVTMTEYLVGVGVSDYDGSRLGEVFSVPLRHRHAYALAAWSSASRSAGVLLLIVTIVIAIWYRQVRGENTGEHRSLLEGGQSVGKKVYQICRGAPLSKQN